jgi:hypothetical protein
MSDLLKDETKPMRLDIKESTIGEPHYDNEMSI